MPWQALLDSRTRQPAHADLGEGYAELLRDLGPVTPFELAVRGARLMATPGPGVSGRLSGGSARAMAQRPRQPGALCATERGGLRVADMQTRVDELRLNGCKDS